VTYQPIGLGEINGEPLPTHVRTPSGSEIELRSEELRGEITHRSGHAVELMMLRHGIFDEAPVPLISLATIAAIGREAIWSWTAGACARTCPRDAQPGSVSEDGGSVQRSCSAKCGCSGRSITARDERCVMVNLDPDTGQQDARDEAVVRMHGNYAGVYGTVVRAGSIHVGQPVRLIRNGPS
jgi:hypothetical protein